MAAAVPPLVPPMPRLFWWACRLRHRFLLQAHCRSGGSVSQSSTSPPSWRSYLVPVDATWSLSEQRVVELIRMPRIIAVCLAGSGRSIAGAALQGVFRNPLVDFGRLLASRPVPAFGGALAILLFDSASMTVALAFVAGLVAIAAVYLDQPDHATDAGAPAGAGGVVTSAFFSALISLIKFVADPDNKLPAIVYWLMGSFASASWPDARDPGGSRSGSARGLIHGLRFRVNVLVTRRRGAQALGVPVERTRWLILGAVTLISAAVVARWRASSAGWDW